MRTNRTGALVCAWIVAAGVASIASQTPLRRDAEQIKQKIASINQRAAVVAPERQHHRNRAGSERLSGVRRRRHVAGRVSTKCQHARRRSSDGKAVVDLDRVREQRAPEPSIRYATYGDG
jgi:hypothetical protein